MRDTEKYEALKESYKKNLKEVEEELELNGCVSIDSWVKDDE